MFNVDDGALHSRYAASFHSRTKHTGPDPQRQCKGADIQLLNGHHQAHKPPVTEPLLLAATVSMRHTAPEPDRAVVANVSIKDAPFFSLSLGFYSLTNPTAQHVHEIHFAVLLTLPKQNPPTLPPPRRFTWWTRYLLFIQRVKITQTTNKKPPSQNNSLTGTTREATNCCLYTELS